MRPFLEQIISTSFGAIEGMRTQIADVLDPCNLFFFWGGGVWN